MIRRIPLGILGLALFGIGVYLIVDPIPSRDGMPTKSRSAGTGFILLGMAVLIQASKKHAGSRHGFCSACGYNLTGNASGVCPECGTQIPASPGASPSGTGHDAGRGGGSL